MRHRSGEGYKKNLLHCRFPKSTVASIILKWKKFGTTRTLTRAGCPAKLSNWWRRALSRLVTKNLMVHSSWAPWSYMQMGETYRSTNITATLHRSGLYGGVAKLNPLQWRHMKILGISKTTPKGPSDSEKQDSLVWWTSILSIKESSSAHHLQSTIPKVKCAGSSLMLWGCFFSGRDWETGQGWGKAEWSKVQRYPQWKPVPQRSGPQTGPKVHLPTWQRP